MKIKDPSPDMKKRSFLKNVLNGTIAGSLYLVYPMGAGSFETPEQIPGIRDNYDIQSHEFAFIVDITRCIGCGSCCVADKREYNVPDGNYRTWVERYVKGFSDLAFISVL
jgi:tetrathionate reductase subunit B